MLPVAVEGHDHVGALEQRKLDAGLQGGTLPQIDRVFHHHRAGRGSARPVQSAEPSSTSTT